MTRVVFSFPLLFTLFRLVIQKRIYDALKQLSTWRMLPFTVHGGYDLYSHRNE